MRNAIAASFASLGVSTIEPSWPEASHVDDVVETSFPSMFPAAPTVTERSRNSAHGTSVVTTRVICVGGRQLAAAAAIAVARNTEGGRRMPREYATRGAIWFSSRAECETVGRSTSDHGKDANRSERSFAFAAPRKNGPTPKISCIVRSVELCEYAIV